MLCGKDESCAQKYSKKVYCKKKRKKLDEDDFDLLKSSRKVYCKKKRIRLIEERELYKQLKCFCYLLDMMFVQFGIDFEEYEHRNERKTHDLSIKNNIIHKNQGDG
jgi:hypothetical protein